MKSVWLSAALLAVAVSACGKGGASVEVVAGAPAGDVTEVAGSVTATRGGQARPLRVGDIVSGDDVIATGPEGRIAITLRHNHVPWSLGPGKSKRVADSAAWNATEGASVAEVADERSGAAGRHAERNGADTAAEAAAAPAAPVAMSAPAAPAPGAAPAPAPAAAEEKAPPKPSAAEPAPVEVAAVAPDPVARGKGATAQDKADDGVGLAGTGEGGGGTGEGIGLGNVGTMGRGGGTGGGAGYGAGAGAGSSHPGKVALADVSVPADNPAPVAVVRRVVVARSGLYRACYQRELARDPSLQGAITFAIDVKDTGLVAKVTAAPPADLVTVSDCVRQQLSRLRFPTQAKAWTASVAMTFKP